MNEMSGCATFPGRRRGECGQCVVCKDLRTVERHKDGRGCGERVSELGSERTTMLRIPRKERKDVERIRCQWERNQKFGD